MSRDRFTPPAGGLWLLQHLLPRSEREPFVGDLLEELDANAVRHGFTRARRWFWWQTFVALLTLHGRRRAIEPSHRKGDSRMLIFLADLRHGARLLRRSPAFTVLAVLTLALGVGATTAIFSVADPILFRALPFPNASRLVVVGERDADGSMSNVGFATYADLARESKTLERAAAVGSWQVTLTAIGARDGAPDRVVSWGSSRCFGFDRR